MPRGREQQTSERLARGRGRLSSRGQDKLSATGSTRTTQCCIGRLVKYCREKHGRVVVLQRSTSSSTRVVKRRRHSPSFFLRGSLPLELAAERQVDGQGRRGATSELSARAGAPRTRASAAETHPWHFAKRYSRPLTLTRPSLSVTFHLFLTRCTFSYRAMTRSPPGSAPSTSSSSSSSSSSSRSELMASSSAEAPPSVLGLTSPLMSFLSCLAVRSGQVRRGDLVRSGARRGERTGFSSG